MIKYREIVRCSVSVIRNVFFELTLAACFDAAGNPTSSGLGMSPMTSNILVM